MGILSVRLKCVSLLVMLVIVTVSLKLILSLFFDEYVYYQVKVSENFSTELPRPIQFHIEVVRILYRNDCNSSSQRDNQTKCRKFPYPQSSSNNTLQLSNVSNTNHRQQHITSHKLTVSEGLLKLNGTVKAEKLDVNLTNQVQTTSVDQKSKSYNLYSQSSDRTTLTLPDNTHTTDGMRALKLQVKRIHINESLNSREHHRLSSSEEILVDDSIYSEPQLTTNVNASFPTIFAITPTYRRLTQKVDLTSLCQTLMNVPQLIWIVVEDSSEKTRMLTQLLKRCSVQSVHLNAKTVAKVWPNGRGVPQRNMGLKWIRSSCSTLLTEQEVTCNGVVYFMDDDNKYDLRLFEEIRKTKDISVLPVAFAGGLKYEGPICKNGKVDKWHRVFAKERKFPVDMAAFAINVQRILSRPSVLMGYNQSGERVSKLGFLETRFLEHFMANRQTLECRGSNTEVYVWHVKLEAPDLMNERAHKSDRRVVV